MNTRKEVCQHNATVKGPNEVKILFCKRFPVLIFYHFLNKTGGDKCLAGIAHVSSDQRESNPREVVLSVYTFVIEAEV